jgi:hypothetical protein
VRLFDGLNERMPLPAGQPAKMLQIRIYLMLPFS